jgi:hypothetical protein
MHRLFLLIALFLTTTSLVMSPTPAHAQDTEESEQQAAERFFGEGARAYIKGDYAGAVVQFLKAYQSSPDPMILYNLSLAYVGAGNLKRALTAAEKADESGALPEDIRPRNRARIVGLRTAITARGDVVRAARRIEMARKKNAEPSISNPAKPAKSTPTTIPAPPPVDAFGAVGWTGVGLQVVGVGVLSYAFVLHQQLGEDIDAFKRNPSAAQKRRLDEEQTFGQALLYSGAGLAALGTGLLFYDLFNGPENPSEATRRGARLRISPMLDASAASLYFELQY